MELICEKYKERMPEGNIRCRHPKEYCKYRTSCLVHFMAGEDTANKVRKDIDDEVSMVSLRFDKGNGLLPAIAQDYRTKEVLMLAYINAEAWRKTLETGKAHYWSRSRNSLWQKGESSGHQQLIKDILVDCDEDAVIYMVEQLGGAACHTGYRSCFHRRIAGGELQVKDQPVFDAGEVYKK